MPDRKQKSSTGRNKKVGKIKRDSWRGTAKNNVDKRTSGSLITKKCRKNSNVFSKKMSNQRAAIKFLRPAIK